ncbi:MAG: polyphosphate polymerase domain-containing protein [Erysipelotrichaceae bacterium]|jgi:hypothetical protein|nr:polyphosphate polymerase domain-containing protein [Erysipelotrichaceae bacterium]
MPTLSFKRVEQKFLINLETYEILKEALLDKLDYDPFCFDGASYLIQNIYYDSVNNDLISHSISKPSFKQKIRLRKYGNMHDVFLENKSKIEGVVKKRRIRVSVDEASDFVFHHLHPQRDSYLDQQIIAELDYLIRYYDLVPAVYLAYDRVAFMSKDPQDDLRVSFDFNIRTRRKNFVFDDEQNTTNLLAPDMVVMEIKTSTVFPLWLAKLLSNHRIYPKSVSKYGTEYMNYLMVKGENHGFF